MIIRGFTQSSKSDKKRFISGTRLIEEENIDYIYLMSQRWVYFQGKKRSEH